MTYDGSVNSDDINAIISSGRYDSGVVYSARRPADVVATDTVKVLPVSGIEGGTAAVATATPVDGGATSVAVSGGNVEPLDRVSSGVTAVPEPILTSIPLKKKYTHVFFDRRPEAQHQTQCDDESRGTGCEASGCENAYFLGGCAVGVVAE